jgi:hypothetical protein
VTCLEELPWVGVPRKPRRDPVGASSCRARERGAVDALLEPSPSRSRIPAGGHDPRAELAVGAVRASPSEGHGRREVARCRLEPPRPDHPARSLADAERQRVGVLSSSRIVPRPGSSAIVAPPGPGRSTPSHSFGSSTLSPFTTTCSTAQRSKPPARWVSAGHGAAPRPPARGDLDHIRARTDHLPDRLPDPSIPSATPEGRPG